MANLNFPPPTDHQEFERLVYEIALAEWRGSGVSMNGRLGQSQAGVDVAISGFDGQVIGIQCKLIAAALTLGTVKEEIKRARSYLPPLNRYIVATTAPSDSALLENVRLLPAEQFSVEVWSWTEINIFLNRLAPLGMTYAEQVILGSFSSDDVERKHAAYVRESLDRAAFLHGAHAERNFEDQRTAVKDTSAFLATGYLYTRDGRLVSQLPGARYRERYAREVGTVKSALHKFDDHLGRSMAVLLDPGSSQHVAARIESDQKRLDVLSAANKIFRRVGIPELRPAS